MHAGPLPAYLYMWTWSTCSASQFLPKENATEI